MRAELKGLHSPDIADLKGFVPSEPEIFSFLLQIIVGPFGGNGEESFDVIVCTPSWLKSAVEKRGLTMGRHYLFMNVYDFDELESYIKSYCDRATGDSWQEIAGNLCRLGRWEFEDMKE